MIFCRILIIYMNRYYTRKFKWPPPFSWLYSSFIIFWVSIHSIIFIFDCINLPILDLERRLGYWSFCINGARRQAIRPRCERWQGSRMRVARTCSHLPPTLAATASQLKGRNSTDLFRNFTSVIIPPDWIFFKSSFIYWSGTLVYRWLQLA